MRVTIKVLDCKGRLEFDVEEISIDDFSIEFHRKGYKQGYKRGYVALDRRAATITFVGKDVNILFHEKRMKDVVMSYCHELETLLDRTIVNKC